MVLHGSIWFYGHSLGLKNNVIEPIQVRAIVAITLMKVSTKVVHHSADNFFCGMTATSCLLLLSNAQ